MRIAIVGAGGIGGYLAARLTAAGTEVAVLARGSQLQAIRAGGLRLDEPDGSLTAHPAIATDDAAALAQPDIVVIAVKAHQVAAALDQIAPAVGPRTLVLPFQNGVDAPDQVAAAFGRERALIGVARIFVNITAPGVLTRYGAVRSFTIGDIDGRQDIAPVRALRALLGAAGVEAPDCTDVRADLWTKFVLFSAASGLTAGTRASFGHILAHPSLRALARRLMNEVVALAGAEGITLPPDVVDRMMEFLASMPPEGRTSTAHDLAHGRPLETDHLCGAVARRGAALGLDMPASATIAALLEPWKAGSPPEKPPHEKPPHEPPRRRQQPDP